MANNPLGTAINDLQRDFVMFKLTEKQFLRENSLESVFQGVPAFAGIHAQDLQAPVTNAIYLERFRAFIKSRFHHLRQIARNNFWRAVPDTVDRQILFQMKLIDASLSFIIPVQMALSFFPLLVDQDGGILRVESKLRKLSMSYEYNVVTNTFEFASGWESLLALHRPEIQIGDYVVFSMDRSDNFFVSMMKRETM